MKFVMFVEKNSGELVFVDDRNSEKIKEYQNNEDYREYFELGKND